MPAPEVWEWVSAHVLDDAGLLHNPDHDHLRLAHIGFLWTNTRNARRGRRVVGLAEIPSFMCNAWQKARQEFQLTGWFGQMPDFVITLDAEYCAECSDIEFCALVEHELYHCAQKHDAFGSPRFNKDTGRPVFEMRGHDVEEFIGVVRRYGVGQPDSPLAQLVQAAHRGAEVAASNIAAACGTCLAKA
jgi:hypothetical protein